MHDLFVEWIEQCTDGSTFEEWLEKKLQVPTRKVIEDFPELAAIVRAEKERKDRTPSCRVYKILCVTCQSVLIARYGTSEEQLDEMLHGDPEKTLYFPEHGTHELVAIEVS